MKRKNLTIAFAIILISLIPNGRSHAASTTDAGKGGHFAAWEQPELFAAELRAAFKSLR
jgi:pimeloyl-ACP methyl ester carboxylesterase